MPIANSVFKIKYNFKIITNFKVQMRKTLKIINQKLNVSNSSK